MSMVQVEHVGKYFKKSKIEAVKVVSLEALRGEIYALLGPNGAGKTTTLRCISTLSKPTNGRILYDHESLSEKNLSQIRRKIGFLTTEIRLDGQFTPNQLADYFGALYGLQEDKLTEQKEKLFSYFGITEYANRKYGNFSTGMKQKTSIAISMIHDPELLILDEPTNGLDILTQQLVEHFILEERDRNKCIILSTHILEIVERLADKVGVIVDGRLVFSGTKEEMVSEKQAKDLHEAFVTLYRENHREIEKVQE